MAEKSKFGMDMQLKMMSATMDQLDELQAPIPERKIEQPAKQQEAPVVQQVMPAVDLTKVERMIASSTEELKRAIPARLEEVTKEELTSNYYYIQSCIAQECKKQGELTRETIARYMEGVEDAFSKVGVSVEEKPKSKQELYTSIAMGYSAVAAICGVISLLIAIF